jgi:hypothetical protein
VQRRVIMTMRLSWYGDNRKRVLSLQDPTTLQILDPARRVEARFQPFPERAIRNGRPRSFMLPKANEQVPHQQPTHTPNRPQSAPSGPAAPCTTAPRPRSSPRLRAAIRALKQPTRATSLEPMHGGQEDQKDASPPEWAVVGRPPWNAGRGFKVNRLDSGFPVRPRLCISALV